MYEYATSYSEQLKKPLKCFLIRKNSNKKAFHMNIDQFFHWLENSMENLSIHNQQKNKKWKVLIVFKTF